MKWINVLLALAMVFTVGVAADAQQPAEVRVAHLSPDAPNVDVWVDGERVLEDVPFQTVSSYLDVPAGQRQIQVTPAGTDKPIVIDATVPLEPGQAYTVAAIGLLSDDTLRAQIYNDDRNPSSARAEVRFIHASPDAPAVDVSQSFSGAHSLFSDVTFGSSTVYAALEPGTYDLDVKVANTDNVALSVTGLELGAATNYTIFATGFVEDGSLEAVVAVDAQGQPGPAQVRVAHLSPDAPNVDVSVDGDQVLSDVPFQAVSDYLEVPAGERRIQVTPAGASEPVVIDATVEFAAGGAFTVAATGLLDEGDLQPLVLQDDRQPRDGQAQVRFVHASPDAPAVDVGVVDGPTLFSDVSFREGSDYVAVDPATVDLEVRPAGSMDAVLTVPDVTLSANTNLTIFAIGQLGDDSLAALPVVDAQSPAQVRVAHLSPDAPNVDVSVDGNQVLSDVPFQAVSDYLDVPAGERRIQVTPAGASEPVVIDTAVEFDPGTAYTVAARGLLDDGSIAPSVYVDNREPIADQTQVRLIHASPDAPAVDVAVQGGPLLFENIAFPDASDYLAVDPATVTLEVRPTGTTDAVLTVPDVTLEAGVNLTIFAVGLVGDETLSTVIAVDAAQ